MAKRNNQLLPDPRSFPDELSQAIAVLVRASSSSTDPWLSTNKISTVLLDSFGINVNVRRVFSILSSNRELVARRKRFDHWEFRVLDAGTRTLTTPQSAVVIVDPTHPIPAIIELHRFLDGLRGNVRICDPYLDATTMSHLDACGQRIHLKLLTENIREEATVRAAVRHFVRNQRSLEIRRSASGKLHDRYMIDGRSVFYLGTSLNGFGKTQSAIIPLGTDARNALLKQFDEEWSSSQQWQ